MTESDMNRIGGVTGQGTPSDLGAAIVASEAENGRRRAAAARRRAASENLQTRIDAVGIRVEGSKRFGRPLSRRRMIQLGVAATGAGLAGAAAIRANPAIAAGPLASSADLPPPPSSSSAMPAAGPNTVYAPAPTGNAMTDTANLLNALNVGPGTTVVLLASATAVYEINQELPVPRGVRVTGAGAFGVKGRTPTLRQAAGVNLYCILASHGFLAGLYGPPGSGAKPGLYQNAATWQQYNNGTPVVHGESSIEIDHIAFDGQNGGTSRGNTKGHGVVLYNSGGLVHECLFVDIANAGIVVADLNWAGTVCKDEHFENRVTDNTVINPGWWGIWVTNTPHSIGCTDGYMLNNSITAPSQQRLSSGPNLRGTAPFEGIRMDNSAGWWVVNNRVSVCPGDGCFFSTSWGLHLVGNRVDAFGCYPRAFQAIYIGFKIYCAGAVKTHPGFINENAASAYEGFNPFGPPATHKTTFRYFSLTMQPSAPANPALQNVSAWVEQANNAAFQLSQSSQTIAGGAVLKGSNQITLPHGTVAGVVQPGMAIADMTNPGFIPFGTVVTNVRPGTGSNPDSITISKAALHTATNDTIIFPGPAASVGWTYINDVLVTVNGAQIPSVMNVQRTNETITGTIDTVPNVPVTNKATVIITDPAILVAGSRKATHGLPVVGQIYAARDGVSADWMSLAAGPPSGAAGGILAGTYAATIWASDRVSKFTADGTYAIPSTATQLRITCVGGGGGGGGGGAASTATAQVGGAGGAAGTTAERIMTVGSETALVIKIGAGGVGGPGAPSGGGSGGGSGGAGRDTTVAGTSVLVIGSGGPGGQGAASNSSSAVAGASYGSSPGVTCASAGSGCGGSSGLAGGYPVDFSPGGGGGGGSSSNTKGGTGGGRGQPTDAGAPGAGGASITTSGRPGSPATSPGAPGGGGGGGTNNTGSGGAGGNGSSGFVVIEIVG